MLEERVYNQPKQKLIYSKDSSLNFGLQQSGKEAALLGLFKSNSSLSRSIRTSASSNISNPLKSSAALILNQSGASLPKEGSLGLNLSKIKIIPEEGEKMAFPLGISTIKSEVPKNQMDIKIRNIVHDYTNVDVNDYSYNLFSNLKSKKRMQHLDTVDEFEVWKTNKTRKSEEEVKNKIEELKQHLDDTKNEIYSKFSMKDEELIPMAQNDIDDVVKFYNGVFEVRDNNINDCIKESIDIFNNCSNEVNLRIIKLSTELDRIGYLLEEEIKALCDDKRNYINRFTEVKTSYYSRLINEIREIEREIKEKSNKDLEEYILRWKNIKLNHYIQELQKLLNSKEYSDCQERADIIADLKKAQEEIYAKKYKLIFETLFNLDYEQINTKNVQKLMKDFEEIVAESEKTLTSFIEKLMKNSEDTQNKTLDALEQFKRDESTISYDFTKDNHNEKKYNDYDEINNLDELIDKEINPIINKNKDDRTNYVNNLNKYLDEYDDYINAVCEKILNIFLTVGKLYDEHKKSLRNSEKNYMISYAKECDNDDNFIHDKEEELKKITEEMRTCINKEELDKGLEDSFKVMDELQNEYREFFKKIDEIFNSHDGLITDEYHKYEIKAFLLFGLYNLDERFAIEKRRNKESDFLSKKKEAEIAEEERIKEEEDAKEEEKTGKKKAAAPKKKDTKAPAKKGDAVQNLVPPRDITEFKSQLGFDYLVDFTVEEYVNHILRNIIYKREDDIFELKPKTPEELEAYQKEKEEYEQRKKEEEESKGKGAKPKKDEKAPAQKGDPNAAEEEIDYLKEFDPYTTSAEKVFASPLNQQNEKLLSEENSFNQEKLTKALTDLFNKINDKIKANHTSNINDANIKDKEMREDQLSDLDIRLKSLSPRKGKIEVEEYDPRLNDLEKHGKKLEKQKNDIIEKNNKTNEDDQKLLEKIDKDFNELKEQNEKLGKSMEEQESDKGLEDQYKKFKANYYDFMADLDENEMKLKSYTDAVPKEMTNSNENFISALKPISKGGTYSDREIEFTKNELEKINNEVIKTGKEEREKSNDEKLKDIRSECEAFIKNITDKYNTAKDNIMAKDAIGKKFGAPKRLANDIIINIKIKCNQSQEGIINLFDQLRKYINEFNEIKDKESLAAALAKNDLPLNVRKQLQKINTCVWNYGKYINAFKETLLNSYQLNRVLMKENIEDVSIVEKEDLDADEQLKKEELLGLGFLAKSIVDPNSSAGTADKKGKATNASGEPSYGAEIDSIDEKVKTECAKIYTGNYAKFLNATEKMPDSLVAFLDDLKREMEIMRLKCVKDLRTFCQNLYKFSLNIPECVYKFIFGHSNMKDNTKINEIMGEFNKAKEVSENAKNELRMKLGPYLANPYYSKELDNFEQQDNERSSAYIKKLNETQFNLIQNEEEVSKDYTIRVLNNFAALMTLFDNFIFDEEFISLGDEEYFKERDNYNQLLKLREALEEKANPSGGDKKAAGGSKAPIDTSKYALDSKRTFKKSYKGINYKEGKINYYDTFNKEVKEYVENAEDKIKLLETEYRKDDWSKSIVGIKLQNNKNLFLERNKYYEQHCKGFNENVQDDINKFNNYRLEELEYKSKWDEMVKDLQNTLKKFNIPEGVVCEDDNKNVKEKEASSTKKKKK